jgi:hypothetical protein
LVDRINRIQQIAMGIVAESRYLECLGEVRKI